MTGQWGLMMLWLGAQAEEHRPFAGARGEPFEAQGKQEWLCYGRGSRDAGWSSHHAQVEVEDYVYVGAGVVAGEARELIDAEEGALGGVVHGTIAAGFGDTDIFDGAITIDGEGDGGFGAMLGTNGRIDGGLHPILGDGAFDGFDVPAVATGEIAAALALHGDSTGGRAGRWRVAGRQTHLAALAVFDGVVGAGRFVFKNLGRLRWGKRLFFLGVELGNLQGVGFDFRRLGRLGFVEALGGIDGMAIGKDIGLRHGNAGAGDEFYFCFGRIASTHAAPGVAAALHVDSDEQSGGHTDVQDDGIHHESLQG
jgi:hypothetical protein